MSHIPIGDPLDVVSVKVHKAVAEVIDLTLKGYVLLATDLEWPDEETPERIELRSQFLAEICAASAQMAIDAHQGES